MDASCSNVNFQSMIDTLTSSFFNLKFLFNRFSGEEKQTFGRRKTNFPRFRIHPLGGGLPFIEHFVTSLIPFKVQTMGSIKGPIPYNVSRQLDEKAFKRLWSDKKDKISEAKDLFFFPFSLNSRNRVCEFERYYNGVQRSRPVSTRI